VSNIAAVLNEASLDLNDVGVLSAVLSNKLSNDAERTVSIYGHPWAVETALAASEGVEVTTILVADTFVAKGIVAAFHSRKASVLALVGARVQCVGSRRFVCLPNVHLRTAGAHLSRSGRCAPVLNIGFAVDKLDVMRALGITVASTVLGASSIVSLAQTAVLSHLNKVESTVKAAG